MVEAIEIYEVHESSWSGDEYESSKDAFVDKFTRRYLADREVRSLEQEALAKGKSLEYLRYYVKPKLVRPEEVRGLEKRPANFIHIEDVVSIEDTCGTIKELYKSEGMSLAYANVEGSAKKHKHHVMEEVYFVVKGQGYLTVDSDRHKIEEGDLVSIPKGSWHFLESEKENPLEVLVATHPKFTLEDVILEEQP
ncbi:MAG: cupin domain-containing protein [archaeon]